MRFIEDLPVDTVDDLRVWDCLFMITDTVLVFDNVNHKIKIITNAYVPDSRQARSSYDKAVSKIDEIKSRLRKKTSFYKPGNSDSKTKKIDISLKSNFKPKDYKEAVKRTKKYIRDGDIIQSVISQRWSAELRVDPLDLYRALRVLNPSPYLFYLKMDKEYLVGSSPEVMVRVEGNYVENRPIAGTRPRGENPEADQSMERCG